MAPGGEAPVAVGDLTRRRTSSHSTTASPNPFWPLSGYLRERYPEAQYWLFRWTGKNSVRARRTATSELLRHMRRVHREQPNALHIVIAHSHGGNIAYRSAAARGAPHVSVVTLSTPFISAARRSDKASAGFVSCAVVPLAMLIARTQFASSHSLLGLLAGACACVAVDVTFRRRAAQFWRRTRLPPSPPSVDLRIVRSPGDEAAFALSSTQALSWTLMKLVRAVVQGPDRVLALLGAVGTLLAWFTVSAILFPSANDQEHLLPGLINVALALSVIGIAATATLAGSFGPEFSLWVYTVEAAAEPTPPGSWTVLQMPPDATPEPLDATHELVIPYALKHSISSMNRPVAKYILAFIAERMPDDSAVAPASHENEQALGV